jgi:hypothetical protein
MPVDFYFQLLLQAEKYFYHVLSTMIELGRCSLSFLMVIGVSIPSALILKPVFF